MTRLQALLSLAVTPILVLVYGFSTTLMWNWFVVPATGAADFRVWHGCGLYLMAQLLTADVERVPRDWQEQLTFSGWASCAILGLGWIVKTFLVWV